MKHSLILVSLFLVISCSQNKTVETPLSRDIDITNAIVNREDVNVSQLVDSVSFIILETTNESLIQTIQPYFTKSHIFNRNYCFDWNGKYVIQIGTKGGGPFEEYFGFSRIQFINGYFYSFGSKFLEFDYNGKPTGKVKKNYDSGENIAVTGRFAQLDEQFLSGDKIILYTYPDTLHFFNTNFEHLSTFGVGKPLSAKQYSMPPKSSYSRSLSDYNDTTVFYNYLNDTIYHINGETVKPAWIVHIGEDYKLPDDFFYRYMELVSGSAKAWRKGDLENCELVKIADNRHNCLAAYETSRYIFFNMINMVIFNAQRGKEAGKIYLIYYDKKTGKVTGTQSNGFKDDILGMDHFMPLYGAFQDKLIKIIWPYQLFDHINKCNEAGITVAPRLLKISQQVKEKDNPIIILGHLKK